MGGVFTHDKVHGINIKADVILTYVDCLETLHLFKCMRRESGAGSWKREKFAMLAEVFAARSQNVERIRRWKWTARIGPMWVKER
jgi:hypothetical protein